MKSTLAAAIVCVACGTSQTGDAGVDAACAGEQPLCCASCLSDVVKSPVCVAGAWKCPTGAVTQLDCVGQCTQTGASFCTYLPKPVCASCMDAATTKMVCNEDAGQLECPLGTHDISDDAGCASDASAD